MVLQSANINLSKTSIAFSKAEFYPSMNKWIKCNDI